jgi:NAD(P)-dependent dehydrogenase (short-subunit alcohol dehydrogenase family)
MAHTALITGASRGLGLALARALAQHGWQLLIDGRGAVALETARAELAQHTTVIAISGDVTDAAHRQSLAEAAAQLGGLDIAVNNASILGPSPQPNLLDYPLEILEQVYRANVIAPLGILQAVRNHLKSNARILNISSDAGVEPYAGWGGYGSSKAAFEHLSAILAQENPAWKVYWVDPGDMQTQMHQEAFPGEDITDRPLPHVSVPGLLDLITGDLPSGRYRARALKDETAGSVQWLNLVLTVNDFDRAIKFYRDELGMPVEEEWTETGHGVLLNAGRATLEIIDEAQAAEIDRVEVGYRTAGPVRLALSVSDIESTSAQLQAKGETTLGQITLTPWQHINQRIIGPEGQQITLFQVDAKEVVS